MGAAVEKPSRLRAAGANATDSRCADAVVEALERMGVDTFYGVPGGAISPVYDALVARPHLRVVHARHESTAVFMAIGHVRMRPHSIPCVLTTSGPGVTNAITGLSAAYAEGVPVVVIGGEVPVSKFGRGALQEGTSGAVDVVGMVRSVTRSAQQLTLPGRVPYQVAAAVAEARDARGPVFLSLPLDVATASIAARYLPDPPLRGPLLPRSEALDAAAEALRSAERPLILVGSGGRRATHEIVRLARRLGCPVITSPKAKGVVPEDGPHCLGVFGYGGHPSALEWLREAPPDVVLAVGCGLNEVSTNSWSPLVQGTRTFIQVDVDASQFGRNYRTDLALHGDARAICEAIFARFYTAPDRPFAGAGVSFIDEEERQRDDAPLRSARVLAVLQEEMPEDTVYTADIGEHLLFAIHHLRVRRPDQFIAALSLGSMGSGIGAAVGAKLAAPDRPVVAICGDYGWQMYGMDLSTCVQEKLGVVFLVMNDHRMRMVEAGIDRIYGRGLPMDGPVIDFAVAARAHGAHGAVVERSEELRRALASRAPDVPLVIDVRIDPNGAFPMNARVAEISNFVSE